MNQMKPETQDLVDQLQPNCNVNMKFNFAVGGLAIATALMIGLLAYVYWWK